MKYLVEVKMWNRGTDAEYYEMKIENLADEEQNPDELKELEGLPRPDAPCGTEGTFRGVMTAAAHYIECDLDPIFPEGSLGEDTRPGVAERRRQFLMGNRKAQE